jgi:hypothetical protein
MKKLNKPLIIGAWGAFGGGVGALLGELVSDDWVDSLPLLVLRVAIWAAVCAGIISIFLSTGYIHYLKRRFVFTLSSVAIPGFFGLFAGAIGGSLAQYLYSLSGPPANFSDEVLKEVYRTICWAVFGAGLGFGVSFSIPNLGRWRGFCSGAIGGGLGGLVFILLGYLFVDWAGRIAGISALGATIGCSLIVMGEFVMGKAWLEVRYGPGEIRTVNLGAEPLTVGSNPSCTVYVPKADTSLQFQIENKQVTCKDIASSKKTVHAPNDEIRLGTTLLYVRGTDEEEATGEETYVLVIGASRTELRVGSKLTDVVIDGIISAVGNGVVGAVTKHPKQAQVLGLMNLSKNVWTVTTPTGNALTVNTDQTVRLARGMKINFGSTHGEIA